MIVLSLEEFNPQADAELPENKYTSHEGSIASSVGSKTQNRAPMLAKGKLLFRDHSQMLFDGC